MDSDRERIMAAIGPVIDLVNAQLRLLFLLEPYDTASGRLPYGTAADGAGEDAAAAAAVEGAAGAGGGGAGVGIGVPQGNGEQQQQEQREQGEASWVQEPFEEWLALPPEDPQYRWVRMERGAPGRPGGAGRSEVDDTALQVSSASVGLTRGAATKLRI